MPDNITYSIGTTVNNTKLVTTNNNTIIYGRASKRVDFKCFQQNSEQKIS